MISRYTFAGGVRRANKDQRERLEKLLSVMDDALMILGSAMPHLDKNITRMDVVFCADYNFGSVYPYRRGGKCE